MVRGTLERRTRLSSSPVVEEGVEFEWEGRRMRGIWAAPEGGGERAVLVTVHGWGSARGGPSGLLAEMCRFAAAKGAAALRFDLPGRGESDGEYGETSLDDMMDAVGAACRFARERLADAGVFLAGICSGANAALGAAALGAAEADGVLALSPLPFQEHRGSGARLRRSLGNVRKLLGRALRPSAWRRLLAGEVDLKGVGKAVAAADAAVSGGRNLKASRRDVPAALGALTGRVCLVWGGNDPEAGLSERYFRGLLGNARVDVRVIPGANHNFYGYGWRREILRVLEGVLATGP